MALSLYQLVQLEHVDQVQDEAFDDVLQMAAAYVVGDIDVSMLLPYATEVADAGTGVDLDDDIIIGARKDSYYAKEIDPRNALLVQRGEITPSIYTPVYYRYLGKAYVKPGGGTLLKIAIKGAADADSVDDQDTTFASMPQDVMRAIAKRAAIEIKRREQARLAADLAAGPTLPTAPTAPSALTISATAPAAPSAPSIAYSNAVADTVAAASIDALDATPTMVATTIAALPTAPVYTPVALTLSFTDAELYLGGGEGEQPEQARAELDKLRTQVEEAQVDLVDAAKSFEDAAVEYQATIQRDIETARLAQEAARVTAEIAMQAVDSARIRATEQARLTQNADQANAEIETGLRLQNQAKQLEAQIADYGAELQLYSAKYSGYAQDVLAEVREQEAALGLFAQEIASYSVQLQSAVQDHQERRATMRRKVDLMNGEIGALERSYQLDKLRLHSNHAPRRSYHPLDRMR